MSFGIFDDHGNALGFYDTREEAEQAFSQLVEAYPAAEEECAIIEFDDSTGEAKQAL